MLIFNKIDGFSFYKKILSVKKTGRCSLPYTLLYCSGIKRLLIFVISLVTKKVHSLLAWTECTNTNKTNNFNKTIFSLKNRFIKTLHVVGNIT